MGDSDDEAYDFAPTIEPPAKHDPPAPAAPSPTAVEKLTPRPGDVVLECPFCGFMYNAKGKTRCPECAAPVDAGTADQLQFADPEWVRGIAMGARVVGLGITLHTVAMLTRIVQVIGGSDPAKYMKGVVHLIAALLVAYGVFAITRPEPGRPRARAPRRLPRSCAVIAAALWGLLAFFALRPTPTSPETLGAVVILVCLCQLPLIFSIGFYLKELARRLPDDGLTSHSTHTTWLAAGVSMVAIFLTALGGQNREYLVFFPISFPIILMVLGFVVWGAITSWRIGSGIASAARSGDLIVIKRQQRLAKKKS